MKHLLSPIVALALALPTLASAAEFQYAELHEAEVDLRSKGIALILSFNTDPGRPVTVMKTASNPLIARQEAYAEFYKQLNWNDATELDLLYVLNRLGKQGWEVVSVRKERATAFVTKDPSREEDYFLKRITKQ